MKILHAFLALCLAAAASHGCRRDTPALIAVPTSSTQAATATPQAPQALDADASAGIYPFPSPAQGAVWAGLRWGMNPAEAMDALRASGLRPEQRLWGKSPGGYVKIDQGEWNVTVYFEVSTDVISQILLIGDKLPAAAATSAQGRMGARFGKPTTTTQRQEFDWQIDGVNALVLTAFDRPDGVRVQEERYRRSPGPVGWGSLAWGMAPAEVARRLQDGGFKAAPVRNLVNHCELPNPPPNCRGPNSTMEFSAGQQTGSAEFVVDHGLVRLMLAADRADQAYLRERLHALKAERGEPAHSTEEVSRVWTAQGTKASLTTKHHHPQDAWTIFEEYTPR
ncbi:MAG: hypothetical protein HY898_28565 [Deltaproteobacteria bacterium]|nr:hypothetical protein [Deltaproteobacteria bacterium]